MFKTRLISGIVLVIAALVFIIVGGPLLLSVLLAISLIGMRELYSAVRLSGKKTLTQLMAERDVLTKRVSVLQEVFKHASSSSSERYSRSEIKYVTTVDVKALRKQIDKLSAQLRQLDIEIQSINFSTELI